MFFINFLAIYLIVAPLIGVIGLAFTKKTKLNDKFGTFLVVLLPMINAGVLLLMFTSGVI